MSLFNEFKAYLLDKINNTQDKNAFKVTKKDIAQGVYLGFRNAFILLILVFAFPYIVYYGPFYQFYIEPQMESYLDDTSTTICKYSENESEIVQHIIEWENSDNVDLKRFNRYTAIFRLNNHDSKWFVYLGSANCGERAIIFEDMVERCGLTYRHMEMEGFINTRDNSSGDHAWSEVWIDNGWRIADSGFHLWYPKDNQSHFTSKSKFLIGHVSVIENNTYFTDCTANYVNNTCQLNIQVEENNESVNGANVFVSMVYNNTEVPVLGYKRDLVTNDSIPLTINLGMHKDAYYNIKSSYDGMIYEHYGAENITLNKPSQFLLINITEKELRWL
ncbi:hypothetical protein MettiDRAFT_2366 [Methanolobus tindarius DSM 2278]|uniref:Transglutaminase-like domain-containing protein n=1 Tax=Methanolobus tindarius DSM 2278 TaxID=1090322 RepID=W9DQL9_METTI|nr:transglutaminase domain-containing protein [Methanolobus tindarius]ETA68879.1 hypothetical protein MettiDRAFT_2366 [Methanolobus tindarius DSM 2278]